MADRLDILLLGATGFTGIHCIPYLHKFSKWNGRNLSWGVAGRSEEKLKQALENVGKKIGTCLKNIPMIIVDITNEESLQKMAQSAKIVINCCGPYRFLGEAVVKTCIAFGTHHLDISAEPQFLEKMLLKYNEYANEKGVYVVLACGFDIIPSDLGVIFLQQAFDGTLSSVSSYWEIWEEDKVSGPLINYGTWESAVYGMGHWREWLELHRKLFPKNLPKFEPTSKQRILPHKPNIVDGWAIPLPSVDSSLVKRSQLHLHESDQRRPVQLNTYFVFKSFLNLLGIAILGALVAIISNFSFGRNLLLKYPRFFSAGFFDKRPPSEERVHKTWFQMTFYGQGWKNHSQKIENQCTKPFDKCIVGSVKGRNPGYMTTCVALVLSAIVIATEKENLPGKGGVFPPGAAFAKTSLIKQLNENGLSFDIICQKDL